MSQDAVDRLLGILSLEQIEPGLYRGTGAGGETVTRIFGGQVIAQALRAAYDSVEDRLCHSLHAYFLRPGDLTLPVIYHVDNSRDGGSFTTRRVVATQNGEQILVLAASFHKAEPGHDHHHPMLPDKPDPESLPRREERIAAVWDRLTPAQRAAITKDSPIDLREITPVDPLEPKATSDSYANWFRLDRPIEASPALHHCLLAYASDLQLATAALRPMGESMWTGRMMTASLDHAMWFHRPVDFNKWHLYQIDSPSASGARGFNRGAIFDQDGRLVASCAQEALVRPIKR